MHDPPMSAAASDTENDPEQEAQDSTATEARAETTITLPPLRNAKRPLPPPLDLEKIRDYAVKRRLPTPFPSLVAPSPGPVVLAEVDPFISTPMRPPSRKRPMLNRQQSTVQDMMASQAHRYFNELEASYVKVFRLAATQREQLRQLTRQRFVHLTKIGDEAARSSINLMRSLCERSIDIGEILSGPLMIMESHRSESGAAVGDQLEIGLDRIDEAFEDARKEAQIALQEMRDAVAAHRLSVIGHS